MRVVTRVAVRVFSPVTPDGLGRWVVRRFTRKLTDWLIYEADIDEDKALNVLLNGMALAFWLSRSYRENIRGFTARYAFQTGDGKVEETASFANQRMEVPASGRVTAEQVTVKFRNATAFRRFLVQQDIMNALMANDITVEGNLNYTWRFMWLAKDLVYRLTGVANFPKAKVA